MATIEIDQKNPIEIRDLRFRYEFFKLDRIDLRVASWILEKHPKALYSFLEFTAKEYRSKSVEIDIEKLYKELIKAA